MAKLITGLFTTVSDATRAIDMLTLRGFNRADISVAGSERTSWDTFGVESHSKVAEGAAVGAGAGGAIGALVAGLTSVGVIATSGIGLLAAGPIVALLAGAGAGAAAGGLLGSAIGLAIPEHEVKYYEDALEKGSVLVGVRAEGDMRATARSVFETCGAIKIANA